MHHAAPAVGICPREPEGCVLPALGGRSRRWILSASNRGFSEPTPADRWVLGKLQKVVLLLVLAVLSQSLPVGS